MVETTVSLKRCVDTRNFWGFSSIGSVCNSGAALLMMHCIVDGLQSIENKEDIVLSQALDDFQKQSKFTLVL